MPGTPIQASEAHDAYVTTTKGMRGWFAVLVWWNPDDDGFWEPWQTSDSSFQCREAAERDAQDWADAEEVRYVSGKR